MSKAFGELLTEETVFFTFTYWEACAIVSALSDKLEECRKKGLYIDPVAKLYSNMRSFHHSFTAKIFDAEEVDSLDRIYDRQLFETSKNIEMDGFSCLLLLRSLGAFVDALEDAGFETSRAAKLYVKVLDEYQKLDLHDLIERSDYGTFSEEKQA